MGAPARRERRRQRRYRRTTGLWLLIAGLSVGVGPARGASAEEPDRPSLLDPLELRWDASVFARLTAVGSEEDSGDVGGFFDQYRFTPDKGSAFPLEIGVGRARFDVLEDQTSRLHVLYESPSSNLGLGGNDGDDPFLNQHARVLARSGRLDLDARYRRIRTESLRVFPETAGSLLPFQDQTRGDERFTRDRTGFDFRLRFRPRPSGVEAPSVAAAFVPEVELRGGFDERDADRQLRTLIAPGNDWLGVSQNLEREVGRVGGGLVWGGPGDFTLALDVDHERLRVESNPLLDDSLPTPASGRSVRFVPSTDRVTGSLRLRGHLHERVVLSSSARVSRLEQVSNRTPAQLAADLDRNAVTTLSGELRVDLRWTSSLETSLFVELNHRDNDLERPTVLLDASGSSQIAPFLERSTRLAAGGEVSLRAGRGARFAVGGRILGIDRELDFAVPGLTNLVIAEENALVQDESRRWRVYGRADLRPLRRLRLRAELGYEGAPETGQILELDERIDGRLRLGWTLPTRLPIQLSVFARGSAGENRDFEMVGGLAPAPQGPRLPRDFERREWSVGSSLDAVLSPRWSVFGSLFFSRSEQEQSLALSLFQRSFQEVVPLTFRSAGRLELQTDELALVLGARAALSERTQLTISYALTRADASYGGSQSGPELDLIDAQREIDATIHGLDLDLGHELRPGLRIFGRYGVQIYDDDARVPSSAGSSVTPFDRSTTRHTITVGLTLEGRRPPRVAATR